MIIARWIPTCSRPSGSHSSSPGAELIEAVDGSAHLSGPLRPDQRSVPPARFILPGFILPGVVRVAVGRRPGVHALAPGRERYDTAALVYLPGSAVKLLAHPFPQKE